MSEQPREQELTPTMQMQEMMNQMAQMRAELDSLKQRAQALPQIDEQAVSPAQPARITSTRRKTLKRLGLALLGGTVAATTTGYSAAEAKITVRPTYGSSTARIGALVYLPGLGAPNGLPSNGYNYGLIASAKTTLFDFSNLPQADIGVYGEGGSHGVYGSSTSGTGVKGNSSNNYGVFGNSSNSYGVYGTGKPTGVYGYGSATSGNSFGVYGDSSTSDSSGRGIGVFGTSNWYGVYGSSSNYGVYGESPHYIGVYGRGGAYGGYFDGNVGINGSLTATTKNFKIDHPLDPANKYLYHTSVESPDMKTIYDGVVILDNQGTATVTMPEWFEALNFDFRYQLTSIGVSMPNLFIAGEMQERKFKIAGGLPGQRVSWMVTGIRQDAYAKAHRSPVEEAKTGDEKGKYIHPELFGQPKEMSVHPKPELGIK